MEAPAVLGGTYLVAYAHVPLLATFVQRYTLNVGGEWLGRVPCLAICQDFRSLEFMVQHCTEEWEPLAVAAGYTSFEEAAARAARSYEGLDWVRTTTTYSEALASYRQVLLDESCSFCKRSLPEVKAMVGTCVRICNYCIDSFHSAIHREEET